MTALIGLAGVILGALVAGLTTYFTTRSNMLLQLKYSYDQTLRDKRIDRYQELFHLLKWFPRYWPPSEEPTRADIRRALQDFHDWYFGEAAGGMFLTAPAKEGYMQLLNYMAEVIFEDGQNRADSALLEPESESLRRLASDLRRQLAEDVGAANPPHLRSLRLTPSPAPPPNVRPSSPANAQR